MGFDLDWCDGGHARKTIPLLRVCGTMSWYCICSNLSYLMNKNCCFCFCCLAVSSFELLMVLTEITTTMK